MSKQSRTFPGLFIILVVLAVFIISAVQGSGAVHGQKEPNYTYFPLVLSGCTNAIPYQTASNLAKEVEMLAALNHERATNGGFAPLARNESLVQIARYHSLDMAVSGVTTHDGSAGETPWDRYGWLCESFAAKGEIIGWSTSGSIDTMVNWWMNSQGHHDLILKSDYTLAGVGYVYYPERDFDHYWTVDFGSKATSRDGTPSSISSTVCTVETFTFDEGGIQVTQCD